jgi:hypothetical protein
MLLRAIIRVMGALVKKIGVPVCFDNSPGRGSGKEGYFVSLSKKKGLFRAP